MKIGDEILVHGYVDEIRENTVIVKNRGGYFGTVEKEIFPMTRAKWKKISPAGIYECQNCKKDVCTVDIGVYKFCHRCGAIMDGVENE